MRVDIWTKLCFLQGVVALNVGPEYSHPIEGRLIVHLIYVKILNTDKSDLNRPRC